MIAFGSRQMAPDMTPLLLPHTSFRCWKRRSSTKHDRCLQAKPRLIYRGTLRIVAAFAAITVFSTAVDAQAPRVFDNAPRASWIALSRGAPVAYLLAANLALARAGCAVHCSKTHGCAGYTRS